MTSSLCELTSARAPEPARFTLWPLPDLGVGRANVEAGALDRPAGATGEEVAFSRGIAEGHRQAAAEFAQRTEEAVSLLVAAADAFEATRAELTTAIPENLQALAVALAQQLLQRELSADPTLVRHLVNCALEAAPIDGSAVIRLHPLDLATLDPPPDKATDGQPLNVRWIADPSVRRGGVLIEGATRLVDGRVDEALLRLFERIAP